MYTDRGRYTNTNAPMRRTCSTRREKCGVAAAEWLLSSLTFVHVCVNFIVWFDRSDNFRLLAFFSGPNVVVLAHGFQKKSQKTPRRAIRVAEERKREHLGRRKK